MQDRSFSPPSPARPADSVVGPVDAERYALLAEFVAAGEQERRRLAEGIHDDSIQAMAALGMRLQMLRRTLGESEQLALLTDAEQAVQLSIARLRHLVVELQPPGLEQEGLSVALAIALDAHGADGTDYRLDDRLSAQPAVEASAILFRIAQEALENVRAHAEASSVTVTLLERDTGFVIRIEDDGCGFDAALAEPGSHSPGFAAMRARAQLGCGPSASTRFRATDDRGGISAARAPRRDASVACCEMLSNTPVASSITSRLDLPELTNGNGMPLVGTMPSTTAKLISAWLSTIAVMPSAKSRPNPSGSQKRAARSPRQP